MPGLIAHRLAGGFFAVVTLAGEASGAPTTEKSTTKAQRQSGPPPRRTGPYDGCALRAGSLQGFARVKPYFSNTAFAWGPERKLANWRAASGFFEFLMAATGYVTGA